jgi:hypothetical protein
LLHFRVITEVIWHLGFNLMPSDMLFSAFATFTVKLM